MPEFFFLVNDLFERIYLDANGSHPALPEAREMLLEASLLIGNPSSSHEHGRKLRRAIDSARQKVSSALKASESDVIFTSGASEANRLFVDSLVALVKAKGKSLSVLMSPFEHTSLRKPVMKACEEGYLSLKLIELDANGQLIFSPWDIAKFDVIICCQAHNETGILPDLSSLMRFSNDHAIIMSDVSQGFSRLSALPQRVDVMTFSAQKMGGFAGCGGAVFRGLAKNLGSPWLGGGQEKGIRPGTECSLLILAMGEAAKNIDRVRALNQELAFVRDFLEAGISSISKVRVLGKETNRLPNTSAICFYEQDADALRIACDLAGLSVGFGSACSGLAPEGSFALRKLGLTSQEGRATIRFSLPIGFSLEHAKEVINRLRDVVI